MSTRVQFFVGCTLLVVAGSVVGGSSRAAAQSAPTPASNVGGPIGVPAARFFGAVSGVSNGGQVVASIGGTQCGTGQVNSGQYVVDIQSISGCTAPGASVSFKVGANPASPAGSLPSLQGSAVMLNLTVSQATPTATATAASTATVPPPPAPPTRAATTAPPPPAPPTNVPTPPAPPPIRTAVPVVPAMPVMPVMPVQSPPKPSVQTTQKPVAQTPKVIVQAPRPIIVPALPRTGTGGQAGTTDRNGNLLLAVLLAAIALGGAGLLRLRRIR